MIILAASPALATGETTIGNPASVFCVESGGKSVIETEADGQRG
jgi:putative hemolysin